MILTNETALIVLAGMVLMVAGQALVLVRDAIRAWRKTRKDSRWLVAPRVESRDDSSTLCETTC